MDEYQELIKPASSFGWVFTLSMALLFTITTWIIVKLIIFLKVSGIKFILTPTAIFTCGVALIMWAYTAIYPTMTYICKENEMVLKCGWYNKTIRYDDIDRIVIKDIKVNPSAQSPGFAKFPGFALGEINYIDSNNVYMCSTRLNKNILMIYLKDGSKVGITPQNPEAFKDLILSK